MHLRAIGELEDHAKFEDVRLQIVEEERKEKEDFE